ncbi:MAG TPA: cellulase family glycosylhydrolase [Chloroflexota bacterium]|nr:cellulase family glycosylhydrolase [Chloroflexota bacterium]
MTESVALSRASAEGGSRRIGAGTLVVAAAGCLAALTMGGWAIFGTTASPSKPGPPPPVGFGYWHTAGSVIEDSLNRPVRIAAVTWFGAESTTWVPGGLDFQPYTKIEDLVKKLGYNTIRLTFSDQMIQRNPIVRHWVRANPKFRGLHALDVFDAIIRYAGKIGLKIILDDQRSAAAPATKKKVSSLEEELWYTKKYPQRAWIADWELLTRRYLGNTTVVGLDLRNEPHTALHGVPGPYTVKTYLRHGATWGPYHGVDNPATDWRLAAEKAADAVLTINNSLLVFVEGIELYPDSDVRIAGNLLSCKRHVASTCVDNYWWGGILKQVRRYPVVLNEPGQLVYSPHEYGPNKWTFYGWWQRMTFRSLSAVFYQQWAFILHAHGMARHTPIFIGETGTCTNYTWCFALGPPRNVGGGGRCRYGSTASAADIGRICQGPWLHLLVHYLRIHPNIGWSFWALNGTNAIDSPTTDGLLNRHWTGVQRPYIQRLLRSIQK